MIYIPVDYVQSITRDKTLGIGKAEMVKTWDLFYRRVQKMNIYEFEKWYDYVFLEMVAL